MGHSKGKIRKGLMFKMGDIMRMLRLLMLIALVLVGGPIISSVFAQKPPFALPPHAAEITAGVFDLGTAKDVDGRAVQGYAFVDPKKGYHHRPGHGGGPGGGRDSGGTTSNCFAFLARGATWKSVESYVLDTTNGDGLSASDVSNWTEMSLGAWELAAGVDIFGTRDTGSTVDGADTESPDGKNEVSFGPIAEPNVIAVTIVWGFFSGPPFMRELVEWDAVFNDPDFEWGWAGPTSETTLGITSIMDYLNISVHEFGHAAGMGHPDSSCTEESMYGFATEGETRKRTLNNGDTTGIQNAY